MENDDDIPLIQLVSNDVLQHITPFIDDPQTFLNWSLVCRKTSNACRIYSDQKKLEFSRKKVIRLSGGDHAGMTVIYYVLPNGSKHGEYTQWFNNGNIRKRGSYTNGMKEGVWELYFYSGNLCNRGLYVRGLKHGPWVQCDVNGNPQKTSMYHMGADLG
jgi:antitoxin component YwqK of YwqJK toxin-antitoxin module